MKTFNKSARQGSVMVYSVILMTLMLGMISFAVDYGRIQIVKSEMQRCADAIALGCMHRYVFYGSNSTGYNAGNQIATQLESQNPVDAPSYYAQYTGQYVAPNYTVTWGSWNTTTQTFVAGYGPTPVAVQVIIKRTAATGNAVPFTFPLISGKSPVRLSTDVIATSVAVDFGTQTANATVSGQSDPWLAGMSGVTGATASDGDYCPGQSPPMVMNVVPGTYISVTNVSGSVDHDPTLGKDPATGAAGQIYSHMCDDTNGTPVQNNIGDVVMPIDALLGVFLKPTAPSLNSAPTSRLDYSTSASQNMTSYNDIQAQQPFYIGTGQTTGGTVQTFHVPPGCTQLYLGTMDGHQWNNNGGSFSATVSQSADIELVQ